MRALLWPRRSQLSAKRRQVCTQGGCEAPTGEATGAAGAVHAGGCCVGVMCHGRVAATSGAGFKFAREVVRSGEEPCRRFGSFWGLVDSGVGRKRTEREEEEGKGRGDRGPLRAHWGGGGGLTCICGDGTTNGPGDPALSLSVPRASLVGPMPRRAPRAWCEARIRATTIKATSK